MYLSPRLYHRFVRPQWSTQKYIHDHIRSMVSLKNRNVLDFGCGTGANCSICYAGNYYGVDPDAQRIEFAKELHPDYDFMVFDEKHIPLADQAIDLILIIAVLHHIPDDKITSYLHEFRRVLKPDGQMMIIEPYLCPRRKLGNWFMQKYDNGEYIRSEDGYLKLFDHGEYQYEVIKRFRKFYFYNELVFTATPTAFPKHHRQASSSLPSLTASAKT